MYTTTWFLVTAFKFYIPLLWSLDAANAPKKL